VNKTFSKVAAAILLFSSILATGSAANAAGSAKTVKGPAGQSMTASKTALIADGTKVTVTGKGYSLKVGIYVTYCVIPAKGKKPELCGPFDITGRNNASVWISSNPPLYAKLLVKPFGKGGTFKESIKVTRMIGDYDCKKVKCALVTRADHTQGSNRKADVLIPVTIK
jgi:hypothetical protein